MEFKSSSDNECYENGGTDLTSAQRAAQFVTYGQNSDLVETNSIEELEKRLFGLVAH